MILNRCFFLAWLTVAACAGKGGSENGTDSSSALDTNSEDGNGTDRDDSSDGWAACNNGSGCENGETCCDGKCVVTQNDPLNCGACGVKCADPTPLCANRCIAAPCSTECRAGAACCGDTCCGATQICCVLLGGRPTDPPHCIEPVNGTCPVGCVDCQ